MEIRELRDGSGEGLEARFSEGFLHRSRVMIAPTVAKSGDQKLFFFGESS